MSQAPAIAENISFDSKYRRRPTLPTMFREIEKIVGDLTANLKEIGKWYCEVELWHKEEGIQALKDHFSFVPERLWYKAKLAFKGEIDPRLLWGNFVSSSYLKRMPVKVQTQCLDEGVKVYVEHIDKARTMKVGLLDVAYCDQVFDLEKGRVRSVTAQKVWAANRKPKSSRQSSRKARVKMPAVEDVLPSAFVKFTEDWLNENHNRLTDNQIIRLQSVLEEL